MKINALIFRQGEDKPSAVVHGVESLWLDQDWNDLVIKSYGLLNYLKEPSDTIIRFVIVEDDQ